MTLYDLAVAGGGPAGCAAAITAARDGGRVLLLEAGTYPRHKVCGEFISAEALEQLACLLNNHSLLRQAFRIDDARLYLRTRTISVHLPASAASIPRIELDRALWDSAVQAGCDARQQNRITGIRRNGDGTFLCCTSSSEFKAKTVVVATGRWSNLHKPGQAGLDREPKWIGIKAHFAEEYPAPSVDLYFFDGGYCGIQPIGPNSVNACAMVRSDIARDLNGAFEKHPRLHARTRSWIQSIDSLSTAPLIFSRPQPERDGVLYAGDAAAFVDPFVGDGISLALHGGMAAARSLAQVWRGKASLEDAARLYANEYATRFSPVLRNAALVRPLLSLPAPLQALAGAFLQVSGVFERVIRMTRVRAA